MKIGQGIFMWSAPERRLGRYGVCWMADETFDSQVKIKPEFDYDAAVALTGQNVKLFCKVLESRVSGHAGDKLLGINPSRPEVDEVVELGVGPCYLEADEYAPGGFAIGIRPTSDRPKYWIDPRKFYRLHDQMVELFVEPSDEPETRDPTPFLKQVSAEGVAISNGDGTFQIYGAMTKNENGLTLKPIIQKISEEEDGGCFMITRPHGNDNEGQVFELGTK